MIQFNVVVVVVAVVLKERQRMCAHAHLHEERRVHIGPVQSAVHVHSAHDRALWQSGGAHQGRPARQARHARASLAFV